MKKAFLLTGLFFYFSQIISAQPGRLDPSFGTNGIARADLGKDYISYGSPATRIILLSNGSMYSLEAFVTKRGKNGLLDSSFGSNGIATYPGFIVEDMAIQPDGKIIAVGAGNSYRNNDSGIHKSDFSVVRYKTDGSFDSSFSGDGKLTTDFDSHAKKSVDDAYTVAVQKDGKIVVAGVSNKFLALARYNIDGSLDSSFSDNGMLTNNFVNADYPDASLAIEDDRKIGVSAFGTMIRYNPDGNADSTFGSHGLLKVGFQIYTIAIDKNDKIVAAGNNYIVRYNTDGSPDKSFSDDGRQTIGFGAGSDIKAIAFQSDGKIVAAGDSAYYAFVAARYNQDGSFDKNFSKDGKLTTDFGTTYFGIFAAALAIQSDGRIVAGGHADPYTAFARYNTDGSPDDSFGNDGKLIDGERARNTVLKSTAIQKDGKVVSAGSTWNGSSFDFVIVRYNKDGRADNTFGSGGAQITDFSSRNDYANSVAIQKDGKIVVAGYSDSNSIKTFSIARYNTDGSIDNTFGIDGKLQTTFANKGASAAAVAIQSDGKIVAAGSAIVKDQYGYFTAGFAVARYNIDGSLDNTFDTDGLQTIFFADDDGEQPGSASSVAIQKDGKIVLGGVSGSVYNIYFTVARLNTNGSIDNTFSDDGKTYFYIDAQSSFLALQEDGKIITGGNYDYRGDHGSVVARYNTDGTVDKIFEGLENTNYVVNSAAIEDNGKIVLGADSRLLRLNQNLTLDSTFGTNAVQSVALYISALAIANDTLYAVGTNYSIGNVGNTGRYLLGDSRNSLPTISLTAPADNATYLAPAAHIKLSAAASDSDGTITKVEFYKDSALLHTETAIPYGYVWRNVPFGNYTLTAKAYDNSGNVTTSAPVHISVVLNKAPVVNIISPVNNQSYTAPANIHIEASASDTDGRVTNLQ